MKLSLASVELPDGGAVRAIRTACAEGAIVVVIDDADRALMMWRHRWILDRRVWELPGGYVDPGEDPAACAQRECEEETGWRPRTIESLIAFQPMVGVADNDNLLFLSRGADYLGAPADVNEAERAEWVPLAELDQRIAAGEIVGAASILGLYKARDIRRSEGVPL